MLDQRRYNDFMAFCHNATNDQLKAILLKEWRASKTDGLRVQDYQAAKNVAQGRGWVVVKGEVV